jgi:hypothetical protein
MAEWTRSLCCYAASPAQILLMRTNALAEALGTSKRDHEKEASLHLLPALLDFLLKCCITNVVGHVCFAACAA